MSAPPPSSPGARSAGRAGTSSCIPARGRRRTSGRPCELRRRHGLGCAAVRGPVDGPIFDRFLAACDTAPQLLSMPGVGMLGALMRDAAVCLCNDTGVAHIAGAVGARCVEVFGPTDPSRWKPVSPLVSAVRAPDGEIGSVTVDAVIEAAERLLNAAGRG